jgi:hypothetical protein
MLSSLSVSNADDKGGGATGGTGPSQGGRTGQETSTVPKPKYVPTKPEHLKKSKGNHGNKRG